MYRAVFPAGLRNRRSDHKRTRLTCRTETLRIPPKAREKTWSRHIARPGKRANPVTLRKTVQMAVDFTIAFGNLEGGSVQLFKHPFDPATAGIMMAAKPIDKTVMLQSELDIF